MPASVPMRGDSSKRIVIPIPQSVVELETSARKNFGTGKLQCFHRGLTQMVSQAHVNNVGDQDVIVVRRSSSAAGPRGYDNSAMTTTHQTSYVKHDLDRAKTPRARPDRKQSSPPAPFMGRSCYSGDYVAHAITPRAMPKAPGSHPDSVGQSRGLEMTGCSTYRENYPRHEMPKREPPARPRGGTENTEPLPFNASSSYTQDYVKHPMRPRSATGPSRRDKVDLGPNPFAGNTTYADDYKKHNAQTARAKIFKPTNSQDKDQYPPPGFAGNSEYRQQYVKKEKPRLPYCFMEPEAKDNPSR